MIPANTAKIRVINSNLMNFSYGCFIVIPLGKEKKDDTCKDKDPTMVAVDRFRMGHPFSNGV